MEKKIGVYICKGCGIGDSLDIEALAAVANDEFSVAVCKDHEFLCSKEGVQVIKEDLAGDGVDTVVVAACSPRVMQDALLLIFVLSSHYANHHYPTLSFLFLPIITITTSSSILFSIFCFSCLSSFSYLSFSFSWQGLNLTLIFPIAKSG